LKLSAGFFLAFEGFMVANARFLVIGLKRE